MRMLLMLAGLVVGVGCNSAGPPGEADGANQAGTLELTIAATGSADGVPAFEARFRNRGQRSVKVIMPQDGSEYGWLSPGYVFSIERVADGKKAALIPRCGNHGATYDSSTMRAIEPGGVLSVPLQAWLEFPGPGTYRATLTYSVAAGKYPGPRYYAPSEEDFAFGPWPTGVFVGDLVSNQVEFDR